MIEEFQREMTADERAWLRRAMQPMPASRQRLVTREGWISVGAFVLTLVVIALAGGRNVGGFAFAIAVGGIVGGYHLVAEARREARRRTFSETYTSQRNRELARVLEDGRVTVKRVRAVAVVELEPIEDEGTGYVFDLDDGRVLFIKGQFYFPSDEEPWPNTDFEIVRAAADGSLLDLYCHGTELPPLRVIPGQDLDPRRDWGEREEVLEMSVDEAVRTLLRGR